MSEVDSYHDVRKWFASKPSRLDFARERIDDNLMTELSKYCVPVPGASGIQIWYHAANNAFYHVKSENKVLCARGMLFSNAEGEQCRATLSFAGNDCVVQCKHLAFSLREAHELCFKWAIELLSCAVQDSSWLVVGSGFISNLLPDDVLQSNTYMQTAQIENVLLLAKKRNLEEKKQYMQIFSVEKLMSFRVAVQKSFVFDGVSLEETTRWESFGRVIHDLVKGAIDWQGVSRIGVGDGSSILLSARLGTEDVPSMSEESTRAMTPPAYEPKTQKHWALPHGQVTDESVTKEAPQRARNRRSSVRLSSRLAVSRGTKKGNTVSQVARAVKSLTLKTCYGVPNSMLPVVVLHRLPGDLLEDFSLGKRRYNAAVREDIVPAQGENRRLRYRTRSVSLSSAGTLEFSS